MLPDPLYRFGMLPDVGGTDHIKKATVLRTGNHSHQGQFIPDFSKCVVIFEDERGWEFSRRWFETDCNLRFENAAVSRSL